MTRTTVKRRRPQRAVTRQHYTDDLRNRYLRFYAKDPDFKQRLLRLVAQYSDMREEMRRFFIHKMQYDLGREEPVEMTDRCDWQVVCDEVMYGDAPVLNTYEGRVRMLAVDVGLDRLPRDKGCEAIHSWFCYWLERPDTPTDHFGLFLFTTMVAIDPPGGTRLTANGSEAVVKVELNSGWKWFSESPGDAKARLVAEAKHLIEREIDRIADAMEEENYVFPRERDEETRHLQWLYQRVKERMSCDAIAGQEARNESIYSSEYIQKTTKDLADRMKVEIPRPRKQG